MSPPATRKQPFQQGEVLSHKERKEQLLVLDYNPGNKTYLLKPLPKGRGETFISTEDTMDGWDTAYLPGPRFVEVKKKGTDEVEWSGYLPDFESALSVYLELEAADDAKHVVEIYAQHDDEREILDHAYYYKPPEDAKR